MFDFLKKWGFSSADKLKNSGASDYVTTYVLYEVIFHFFSLGYFVNVGSRMIFWLFKTFFADRKTNSIHCYLIWNYVRCKVFEAKRSNKATTEVGNRIRHNANPK